MRLVFIGSLFLFTSVFAFAQESTANALTQAERLQESGRHEQAYKLLSKLLREAPDSERVNMAYAAACREIGDLSRAQLALERVMMINPDNLRAKVELSDLFMAADQQELAQQGFRNVLEEDLPPTVRNNIQNTLRRIEKPDSKWNFSGRIDVGYFSDDNVNIGPSSKVIYISPIIFSSGATVTSLAVDESSQPLKDEGPLGSAILSSTYDCGKRSLWYASSDISYYQNWLQDHSEHETQFYQIRAGMKRAGTRSLLEIPIKTSHITRGDDDLLDTYGIDPRIFWIMKSQPGVQFVLDGALHKRDYETLNDRDGTYHSIGGRVRKYIGKARHSISIGVAFFGDDTDADIYKYSGHSTSFGWRTRLPWDTEFYATFKRSNSDYKEKETLALEERADAQNYISLGLTKTLNDNVGLNLHFQKTNNDSTFDLYEFERNYMTATTFVRF